VGLNTAFVFNAEVGFEVVVVVSYRELPGAFRVELHSSGKYAHATLSIETSGASFYTCCDDCFRGEICRGDYRDTSEVELMTDEVHRLHLIYDPIYRRVESWIDGTYRLGGWIMPIEFDTAHLRLFVNCRAECVGPVDVEIHEVLIGLGRSDRTP